MIRDVITYLNGILTDKVFINAAYALTELKTDNGVTQPVIYNGRNYTRLKMNQLGVAYWRKDGSVDISVESSQTSCKPTYLMTYNVKLFCMVKRQLFADDNSFLPDELAMDLIKDMTFIGGSLKRQLGLDSLSVQPTGYSTNSESIINAEFAGSSRPDFNYNDAVVSIDFDIVIGAKTACMDNICVEEDEE